MSEFSIKSNDLFHIISTAKSNFMNLTLPMDVSGKEVSQGDLPMIAMIEALTMYLNRNKLLTTLVKIDYTDVASKFEETV